MDYENITYEGKDYILRGKDLFKTLDSTERCGFISNYKVVLVVEPTEVDMKAHTFTTADGEVKHFTIGTPDCLVSPEDAAQDLARYTDCIATMEYNLKVIEELAGDDVETQIKNIKHFAKNSYEYCKLKQHDRRQYLEGFVWFHIFKLNKARAVKAFDKYKIYVDNTIDNLMFGENKTLIETDYGILPEGEALRRVARFLQLKCDTYTGLISLL